MIPHHTEVRHQKTVALLRAGEEDQEEIADLAAIEEHFASIDARGDMIPRTVHKLPGASHASNTPPAPLLASNR